MSEPKWQIDSNGFYVIRFSTKTEAEQAIAAPALLEALEDAPEPPGGFNQIGSSTIYDYARACADWFHQVRSEALRLAGAGPKEPR